MAEVTRWYVHVEFLDGAQDEVIGLPNVVDGNLTVTVTDQDGMDFEACYPLRHVRVWWCEYVHETARKNARGRRRRVVEAPQVLARHDPAPTTEVDP